MKNLEVSFPAAHSTTSNLPEKRTSLDSAQALDRDAFPHQPRSGSSQLPATIANIRHMLKQYGVNVRYNVIKKKVEIIIPGHTGTFDNKDNVSMTYIISLAKLNGLATEQVPAFVEALADENVYNPVADWITSKPWDGKDRLPEFYDTITEQEDFPSHLKKILIYRWLLSAVAAIFTVFGFTTRGVLTLLGPQGVGKTTWFRMLISEPLLREIAIKTDHHFDGSKDSIIGAVIHWIVEIGELDSSFRKDISRLKGFLTRDYDKLRRPYARTESEYQRRTVFCASVNKTDFLIDMTGNSRWWTIPVVKIDYKHNIDMQQLFAQLAEDFHKGKQWWLTQEEEDQLDYCNKDHRSVSVIRESLLEAIDLNLKGDISNPAMSASEVLRRLGYKSPTNPQSRECGGILRELVGEPKKIQGIKKWRIPLRQSPGIVERTPHKKHSPDYIEPLSDDDY
jgi:putative DNA primase/helicase